LIVLFTDFGTNDPYVGQLKARLAEAAPTTTVIDLIHAVPDFNPHAGAHLLAAFASRFPTDSVFLAVVDPGVGTLRDAVVLMADGRWFVGPDNGLLSVVAARSDEAKCWRITWQPDGLSNTFHGRDLFAVVAAEIARGDFPHDKLEEMDALNVMFDAGDLPRIIFIDHFGNAWTGLRGEGVSRHARINAGGHAFKHSESFGLVSRGDALWLVNSVGLLELAINLGNAAAKLGLSVGMTVEVVRFN
jgi:S-adenosyl-L-methionine hydrolase (adenosine-forming)